MKPSQDKIVKALKLCSGVSAGLCSECPFRHETYCEDVLFAKTLALIQKLDDKAKRNRNKRK